MKNAVDGHDVGLPIQKHVEAPDVTSAHLDLGEESALPTERGHDGAEGVGSRMRVEAVDDRHAPAQTGYVADSGFLSHEDETAEVKSARCFA